MRKYTQDEKASIARFIGVWLLVLGNGIPVLHTLGYLGNGPFRGFWLGVIGFNALGLLFIVGARSGLVQALVNRTTNP